MQKIAFFVEGHTEAILVERLVRLVAGRRSLAVRVLEASSRPRHAPLPSELRPPLAEGFFALIYNCCSDSAVKSKVVDNYDSLARADYTRIVVIRDLYPDFTLADEPRVREGFPIGIPRGSLPVELVLGVLETEAWFLAEHSHFMRVDNQLTSAVVNSELGFDASSGDVGRVPHPANSLHRIYSRANLAYRKRQSQIRRTVAALDLISLAGRTPEARDFPRLFAYVEEFLT